MKKYMVTIYFPDEQNKSFWKLLPNHRSHIMKLMEEEIIFSYAINQLRTMGWMVISAETEKDVVKLIEAFPIRSLITYDIDELFIFDSSVLGLPKLVMN